MILPRTITGDKFRDAATSRIYHGAGWGMWAEVIRVEHTISVAIESGESWANLSANFAVRKGYRYIPQPHSNLLNLLWS